MSWVDERLNSTIIDKLGYKNFNEMTNGKNILISPEGSGKSTNVLSMVKSLDKPVIFSTHTIANAIEKYKMFEEDTEYVSNRRYYLIESDSELFRKMLKAQNDDIYDFFKKHLQQHNKKYLMFEIYSYQKGRGFRRVGNSESYRNKIKSQLQHDQTPSSYNSVAMQIIYNVLNSAGKDHYYHIVFKFTDDPEELMQPISNKNIEDTIFSNRFNSYAIQKNLQDEDIQYFCITPKSLRNWRGLKKQRDNDIKEAFESDNPIIITQNKVTENLILPKIKKKNIDCLVVYDEITSDSFISPGEKEQKKVMNILNKMSVHGENGLSVEDEIFLEDFGIKKEVIKMGKEQNGTIILDEMRIRNSFGEPYITIGKPYLNKRLTSFPNTLILTSEKLLPSILVKGFGYKCFEIENDYLYEDDKLFLHPTDKNTPIQTTKTKKDGVVQFIKDVKEYDEDIKELVTIGTSYFNADLTLEACKGRNFSKTDNVMIFKNPDPISKFNTYIELIEEYENEPITKDLVKNVQIAATVDLLNQTIGRISGKRRRFQTDANINLYYYKYDNIMKEALENIRYKGKYQSCTSYIKKINSIKTNLNNIFEKADEVLSIYEDTFYTELETGNKNPYGNLHDYTYRWKKSKKEVLSDLQKAAYKVKKELLKYNQELFPLAIDIHEIIDMITDIGNSNFSNIKIQRKKSPNHYLILVANLWKHLLENEPIYDKQIFGNTKNILIKSHLIKEIIKNKNIGNLNEFYRFYSKVKEGYMIPTGIPTTYNKYFKRLVNGYNPEKDFLNTFDDLISTNMVEYVYGIANGSIEHIDFLNDTSLTMPLGATPPAKADKGVCSFIKRE